MQSDLPRTFSAGVPNDGFDLHESYTEELFKGWIETAEAARHIIEALRLDSVPLQALRTGVDGRLQCESLT